MIKPISTKNQIIEILSKEFPLSVKQIHTRIKKNKKASYQAIHKSLKELESYNVTRSFEKHFLLNSEWIKSQNNFISTAYQNYFKKSNIVNPEENIQFFEFNSIKDINKFINQCTKNSIEPIKIYIQIRRLYPFIPIILNSINDKIINNNSIYIACRSNNLSDKFTADYLESQGFNVRLGAPISHFNTLSIGNKALTWYFFHPNKTKIKIETLHGRFNESSSLKSLKLASNFLNKKIKVYAVLNSSKTLVEDIKNTTLNFFQD
tara:strand:- start:238 stop:1026 length:789 start_codon:yes stop_codon:yes gene_type:complete